MSLENPWNDPDRRKPKKTCCSATLSITNPMCIGLGLNSGLQSVRVVTNYLSHGKALLVLCVNGRGLGEDVGGHFSIF